MCLFSTEDSVRGIFEDEAIWQLGDEVVARDRYIGFIERT